MREPAAKVGDQIICRMDLVSGNSSFVLHQKIASRVLPVLAGLQLLGLAAFVANGQPSTKIYAKSISMSLDRGFLRLLRPIEGGFESVRFAKSPMRIQTEYLLRLVDVGIPTLPTVSAFVPWDSLGAV